MSNFSFSIVLSDNSNTEASGNCTVWQALFGGAVVLGLLIITQWKRIKLCFHRITQIVYGSFQLATARNNVEHCAQGEDTMDEGSQVQSECNTVHYGQSEYAIDKERQVEIECTTHYGQSEDATDEESLVESQGTDGLGWDGKVMPPEL